MAIADLSPRLSYRTSFARTLHKQQSLFLPSCSWILLSVIADNWLQHKLLHLKCTTHHQHGKIGLAGRLQLGREAKEWEGVINLDAFAEASWSSGDYY